MRQKTNKFFSIASPEDQANYWTLSILSSGEPSAIHLTDAEMSALVKTWCEVNGIPFPMKEKEGEG